MSVRVLHAGLLTTVQDRGRFGHAGIGVGSAGPMDEVAHRLANLLVGNAADAAALELTLVGPRLHFGHDAIVALVGAPCDARVDGVPLAQWKPTRVGAGATLACGRMRQGMHATLAVAGGFAVERVLGSAATDLNAGIGPLGGRALRAGDVLAIAGRDALPDRQEANWSLDPRPWFDADPHRPLRLVRGAHAGLLAVGSRKVLFGEAFRVHADSNRVGFRLDGPLLRLADEHEALSAATSRGVVQLPPAGRPIVLMAEHPTTGGYPRIGQVAAVDLPLLAQRPPGTPLRFVEIGIDEAQARHLARERALTRLAEAIAARAAGVP